MNVPSPSYLSCVVVREVAARGHTPVLVGGTGFYLRWMIHGRPGTPRGTEESGRRARQAVQDAIERDGAESEEVSYVTRR